MRRVLVLAREKLVETPFGAIESVVGERYSRGSEAGSADRDEEGLLGLAAFREVPQSFLDEIAARQTVEAHGSILPCLVQISGGTVWTEPGSRG